MNGYDVEVEWMDGNIKEYPKVLSETEDGLITIFKQDPTGIRKVVISKIPLVNVREVRYPQ